MQLVDGTKKRPLGWPPARPYPGANVTEQAAAVSERSRATAGRASTPARGGAIRSQAIDASFDPLSMLTLYGHSMSRLPRGEMDEMQITSQSPIDLPPAAALSSAFMRR